jgi:hypothetical protein
MQCAPWRRACRTYITLKDVKKRWGQRAGRCLSRWRKFEKLWGDMTALPELHCRFIAVPRQRGQQLKEPAQLDAWLRDGSAAYTEFPLRVGVAGPRRRVTPRR